MPSNLSRRLLLAAALGAARALFVSRPPGTLVDVHVHLFSADPARFPYPANAPYQPKPSPLEDYVKVVAAVHIDHTVIVHPEPYQGRSPVPGILLCARAVARYFKGTCLFDPIAPETPERMA